MTIQYIGKQFSRPLLEKRGIKKRGERGEVEKKKREILYRSQAYYVLFAML